MAMLDNATAGCYDNITPQQVMLNCRRIDLTKSSARMLTIILNNTIYRIWIVHGLSAKNYQTDALRRILGGGAKGAALPRQFGWSSLIQSYDL